LAPTASDWTAIIFLVHPIFTLQFISVAFSQHWTVALLYSFSVWAMLNSFGSGWKRWVWWGLALASSALHLLTMEYFLGMEIFRYVLIWLTLGSFDSMRQRLSIFVRRAVPYALVLASFIIWRLFIFEFPQEDPNPLRFLQDFSNQPLTALLTLVQIILRDLLYMLVQVWASVLDSSRLVVSSKFFLFAVLFSSVVAVVLALYFSRPDSDNAESALPPSSWIRQAFWVGLLAIVLGALPGWITYREALVQPYGNRITIPALLGLGILTVVLIEWVTQNQNRRTILLSVLCGISIFSHLHVANNYREAWNIQRSLYWQLYWRMPALQPGTSLLSDSEIVLGAGEYSTVSALNLLYATEFDIQDFPYWFFNMTQRFRSNQMNRLFSGRPLSVSFRSWHFEGDGDGILLVNNSTDGCMQILSANQPENSQLSALLTEALPRANLSRIISETSAASVPPAEIFGREPAHTWCYYYQKANLARQSEDWTQAIALLEEADQQGYEPAKKSEWLLFVDAYTRMGDFSGAEELTSRIQARDPRLTQTLCTYWSGQTALPAGFQESLLQKLECSQPGTE
jgi:tetratricopeptide (TPR) repeat protein